MKRAAIIVSGVVLLILLVAHFLQRGSQPPSNPSVPMISSTSSIPASVRVTETTTPGGGQASELIGETILRDYANTNLPPQNDLTLMSHLMDNSLLLLKSAANRPLSANEDWADLFRGKNGVHERFLSDSNVALNAQGQLIDRWQTPLFFHALGNGRYEIRSAGPDRKLWTDDDIHRNADGSFRRGKDLNSSSLFESSDARHP